MVWDLHSGKLHADMEYMFFLSVSVGPDNESLLICKLVWPPKQATLTGKGLPLTKLLKPYFTACSKLFVNIDPTNNSWKSHFL